MTVARGTGAAALERHVVGARGRLIDELLDLVAIPSMADEPWALRDAADRLAAIAARAGLDVDLIEAGGPPVVLARGGPSDTARTVLVYGHYDVVGPGELEAWEVPPFAPVVHGDRVVGRGAGDNKGQHLAWLHGIEALLAVAGELPVGVVVLLEGEEELGSPHLAQVAGVAREALRADVCVYSDGPMLPGDRPLLAFGARGAVCLRLVARGASRVLHSGHFGGIAPTPALDVCRVLSELGTPGGPLLAAAPVAAADAQALDVLADAVAPASEELGLTALPAREAWERLTCRTALNVSGLMAGLPGPGLATAIPPVATATIDVRFVAGRDPAAVIEAVRRTARRVGEERVDVEVLSAQPASRTSIDNPFTPAIAAAVHEAFGRAPLALPCLPATTPDHVFTGELGLPSILVPFAPHDEANHAPNESTRVSLYLRAVQAAALILTGLGAAP